MSGIDNIAWLNNDPDFEDFLKKRTHVREESLGRVERFLSKKYFKDVTYSNTRTQQVVIKIPNKGYGAKHLHYLTKYIARELSSQENEQSQIVYNQDGDIVGKDDFVNVVEEWSKDFPSENSELSEEASNVLNELDRYAENLLLEKLRAKSKAIIEIKKAYDKSEINIPFPIRTLQFDNKLSFDAPQLEDQFSNN